MVPTGRRFPVSGEINSAWSAPVADAAGPRLVRVRRACSGAPVPCVPRTCDTARVASEAPGRTCQHRGPQATHRTPEPQRHQSSTRAGRRQTRPPGVSWDPGPARAPGGTTAGHLPPAEKGRTIRDQGARPVRLRVGGGPWRHIPKRHGKSASTPFSSMRSARHGDGHRVATDESVGERVRSRRIASLPRRPGDEKARKV